MNKKIKENALTKCEKCDCLILSDSSDPDNCNCIHPGTKEYEQFTKKSSDNNSDNECQSHVKITVQTKCLKNENSSTSDSLTDSSSYCRRLQTDFSMKNICFRLCPKKKTNSNEGNDKRNSITQTYGETLEQKPEEIKSEPMDTTPKTKVSENKVEPTPKDTENSIDELMKKYGIACKPPGGGCNTNAIIFPNNKMSGDSFTKLEDFIKTEIRNSDRKMEEILNELYRQRREIREVKDLLELVAKIVKDQMFMKNGKNGLYELCLDVCKKNCLERKSNSLSLSKTANQPSQQKEVKTAVAPLQSPKPPPPPEEEKKKKRGLFSWCL